MRVPCVAVEFPTSGFQDLLCLRCITPICWLTCVLLFLALSVLIINRIPMRWPLVQLSQESFNCDSTSTTFNSFFAFSVIMGTIKTFPSQLHTVVPEKPLLLPILNIGNIRAYVCRVTVGKCWLLNGDVKAQRGTMLSWTLEMWSGCCGLRSNAGGSWLRQQLNLRTKYVKTERLSRVNENWSFISLQAIF